MSASNESAPPLLVPTQKGMPEGAVLADKYRIDALLAEGGMGLVYLGWHLILDQAVAIKLVRPELAHRPDAAERFLNEARAVARLRGPNVARVLDSGRTANGQLYMVFEYLQGADLRTVLDTEGPLPIERAVDYVLQAAEAMAEAHAAGIVHRDLKPENLFLTTLPDGTDQIKVLDFGISKRLDDNQRSQTVQGQNLGSPHYMAPEQMSTPSQVDTRADLWSLGIVLFELLSGDVPFDGDTVPTICAQVLGREAAPIRSVRPDVPAGLEAVIRCCLEKKVERRYQTVSELADALAPFGSEAASGSARRIRRLFGFEAASIPDVELDVDVDLSSLAANEQTPLAGVSSIPHKRVRPVRRALLPVAAALAAGVMLAVGLPQGAFVSEAMAQARARFSAAMSGGSATVSPLPHPKPVAPVVQAARPAISESSSPGETPTLRAAATSLDVEAPSVELDAPPADAPVLQKAQNRRPAPRAWSPRRGRAQAPARPAPAAVPAPPAPSVETPAPGAPMRPAVDVDQLIPPYDSKAPAGRSGDLSFRSTPAADAVVVVRERLDDQASSRVSAPAGTAMP